MSTPAQMNLRGSCLCGLITYEVQPPVSKFAHCHCSRCRKATGAAHASNVYVPAEQLLWRSGHDHIRRFDLASALSFAKWFCDRCGSPVPRISRSGKLAVVPAGSLDDVPHDMPSARIFCSSDVPWACRGDGLPRFSEYPNGW